MRNNHGAYISVAMATYNGEKYLEEQIDSILAQSLPPSEIIVSDDRSSDNTVTILERYARKGLLKYVVNERQVGLVANFKKAVAMASETGYVALSDQDDIWLPQKLEICAEKLKSVDDDVHPAMVYSDLILVDKEGNTLNESYRNELNQDGYRYCLRTLLFGNFVNGCTVLMNQRMKGLFSTIPDNIVLNHDAWIALIAYTFGIVDVVPGSLMRYRKHDSNVTGVSTLTKKNRIQRIKSELGSVWGSEVPYLEEQLTLVGRFYEIFQSQLSEEDRSLLKQFLWLKNRSYLTKKIVLRWFFRGQWL